MISFQDMRSNCWSSIVKISQNGRNARKTAYKNSKLFTMITYSVARSSKQFPSVGGTHANSIPNYVVINPSNSIQSNSFALELRCPDEIIVTVNSLKSNTTMGWDGISERVLKRYVNVLALVLSHIFNICFQMGVFPT